MHDGIHSMEHLVYQHILISTMSDGLSYYVYVSHNSKCSSDLLTTPMRPSLTGMTLPISTSIASVPASIRSSLVTTARVLLPEESRS